MYIEFEFVCDMYRPERKSVFFWYITTDILWKTMNQINAKNRALFGTAYESRLWLLEYNLSYTMSVFEIERSIGWVWTLNFEVIRISILLVMDRLHTHLICLSFQYNIIYWEVVLK